jgi:hypothetical protein
VAAGIGVPTELPSIVEDWNGGTLQWNPPKTNDRQNWDSGGVGLGLRKAKSPESRNRRRGMFELIRENHVRALIASLLPAMVIVLNVITA